MKAMIFDMDGTLADVREIAHYFLHDREEDKDYDAYHHDSVEVPVVDWVLADLLQAHDDGYKILIMTARKKRYEDQTREFLYRHKIPASIILMRDDDDNCPDDELKKDLLELARRLGYKVEKAYEDNPTIVALWESEGIEAIFVEGRGFNYERLLQQEG